jgi:hypothetical protein
MCLFSLRIASILSLVRPSLCLYRSGRPYASVHLDQVALLEQRQAREGPVV